MQSKLNITEFRAKIKNNTVIGHPKLKLISPFSLFKIFGGISKPFYGNYDDSTFRLITNSAVSLSFYLIKGKYKTTNGSLNIDYVIEPTHKLQLIWVKYFPIIAFVVMNLIFISEEKVPTEAYIIFNLFIAFVFFHSRWSIKRKIRNLERKFNEVFEIIA
nr:hypothetical protein [uncultured Flavobacterium sp.]